MLDVLVPAAALYFSCSTRCTVPRKHQLQSPHGLGGGAFDIPRSISTGRILRWVVLYLYYMLNQFVCCTTKHTFSLPSFLTDMQNVNKVLKLRSCWIMKMIPFTSININLLYQQHFHSACNLRWYPISWNKIWEQRTGHPTPQLVLIVLVYGQKSFSIQKVKSN